MAYPVEAENSLPELFTTGKPVTRGVLMAFEDSMRALGGDTPEDYEFCLSHSFAPGIYARELFIPKGMAIVGKIHKHAHHNNISLGKIAVATEFGSYTITAPYSFVSVPGTKRAVYALEDTMWTTYHLSSSEDLEGIEDEVIAQTFEEFDCYAKGLLDYKEGE